jgi:hypothetical protein
MINNSDVSLIMQTKKEDSTKKNMHSNDDLHREVGFFNKTVFENGVSQSTLSINERQNQEIVDKHRGLSLKRAFNNL